MTIGIVLLLALGSILAGGITTKLHSMKEKERIE